MDVSSRRRSRALIRKYPGRFKLMHIKDMKPGVARGSLAGGLPAALQAVIGQGQVNWPEVMKAAKTWCRVLLSRRRDDRPDQQHSAEHQLPGADQVLIAGNAGCGESKTASDFSSRLRTHGTSARDGSGTIPIQAFFGVVAAGLSVIALFVVGLGGRA